MSAPGLSVARARRLQALYNVGIRRGRLFAAHALVAFGVLSAAIQFFGQLYPSLISAPGRVSVACVVLCVGWALGRTWSRSRVRYDYRALGVSVTVAVGDLLAADGNIVVGFSDTFDTDTGPGGTINPHSLQGQLLERVYQGDCAALDRELARALRGQKVVARETRAAKRLGKLARYAPGTVAVLDHGERTVFAVAYSRMGNDGVAQSSVDDLGHALNRLWDAVAVANAEREPVAMPLVGSGLARIDALDREGLVRVIVQSFLVRSHRSPVCRELKIVIGEADRAAIDLYELNAYLRTMDMAGRA